MFERKKLKIETLGEYLLEIRRGLNLELPEVSKQTGISQKFLTALESGNFEVLPPDVYIFGFLRQLSKIYNLDSRLLIGQYEKEKAIATNIKTQGLPHISKIKYAVRSVVVTPKSLSIILGVLFVVLSIGYIIWQVLSINKAPDLQILAPGNNQPVVGSLVEIKGLTQPGSSVQVNQQEVFVESDGSFATELGLTPGPKELVITATNKFGKTTSKTITIIGQNAGEQKNLTLVLRAAVGVEVDYIIDNGSSQHISLTQGQTATLEAQRQISLSTQNAGALTVSKNGGKAVSLGAPGESVEGVSFSAESGNINNNTQ